MNRGATPSMADPAIVMTIMTIGRAADVDR
jgi:hypothetical protein